MVAPDDLLAPHRLNRQHGAGLRRRVELCEADGANGVEEARALRERVVIRPVLWRYCRIAFTAFGVSVGFAWSISATVPATTGAAMLVPLSAIYGGCAVGIEPASSAFGCR